jgi:hypothetical protein
MNKYLSLSLLAVTFSTVKCDTMELVGPILSIAAAAGPSVLADKFLPDSGENTQLANLVLSASALWVNESCRKNNYKKFNKNAIGKPVLFGAAYKLAKFDPFINFLAGAPVLKSNLGLRSEIGTVARSLLIYLALSESALYAGYLEKTNL